MKREEIPGYKEIRKELTDARIMQVKATTVAEREAAKKLVAKLRRKMAEVISDYKVGGKVK